MRLRLERGQKQTLWAGARVRLTQHQWRLVYRHCGTAAPLFSLDITDNIQYNEYFLFNSFFILVHYIILKLNVNSHPLVHEIITKILVWNYALHSF